MEAVSESFCCSLGRIARSQLFQVIQINVPIYIKAQKLFPPYQNQSDRSEHAESALRIECCMYVNGTGYVMAVHLGISSLWIDKYNFF
jgi:hypothetical protein